MPTPLGERLKWARERAGLSQSELARRVGIKQQSVNAIEKGDKAKRTSYVAELAKELGVNAEWLASGTGEPLSENLPNSTKSTEKSHVGHSQRAQTHDSGVNLNRYYNVGERRTPAPHVGGGPRDLEVRGTAIGGDHGKGDFRFNGDIVDYVRRPSRLEGVKDAFVIYLQGSSMEPRYKAGDKLYIHPGQPPRVGDDVLVELHPERDGEPGGAMVKELVARTPTKLRLKQHKPPNDRIEVDLKKVKNVYRVVPYSELLEL